jgi:type I restriction enzyme, S subunit
MKKGWETKTLGDLFDITSSKRVFEADWKREGVPFYRAREIVKLAKQGYVDNELFISEEMFNAYATKYGIPTPGDIMVTGVGTLGICYVVKEGDRFYFKDGNIIWLKKRSDADSRFVEYAFQSGYLREQIDDSVGATVGTYTIIKAKSTRIPVPPLPEQQRIVGILDEAFEGIATAKANAEKNLENARALFESHLQSVFTQRGKGWVEKRLCEVATSISTGPFGTMLHKSDYVLDGIPLVNPMNIVGSTIVPSSKMMVNAGTRDRLSGYVLKVGDVVVGRRGELGRCALVTEREAGWLCGTGSFFIRLSDAMDGEFFVALFGSEQFKARLEASAVGTTMSSLNHGILNDLVLPVPPLVEQRTIMEKAQALLAETQRLASVYERKLGALEALRKSLLHRAFNGELTRDN